MRVQRAGHWSVVDELGEHVRQIRLRIDAVQLGERQLEGINAAKVRGVYKGRKPSIDAVEVVRLRREETLGPAAIARRRGIGRASVYRLLGKQAAAVKANGSVDADQA